MSTGEDEERELIAAVRNLLTQPGGLEAGKEKSAAESVGTDLPPPSPEEDVREETVPEVAAPVTDEKNEQPEQSPVQAQKGAGIRSFIETVARSGDAAEPRVPGGKDPVRALLNRIGRGKEGASTPTVETHDVRAEAEMSADLPAAVEDFGPEADVPAPSPRHHGPAGILDRMKGWREDTESSTPGSGSHIVEEVDDPGLGGEVSDGVVTVDELGNLADLILPKSATFTIDELNINRNEHSFDFVDNARVVSEFDDIFSQSLSSASLAAAAAQVATPVEEVPQPRFGFLKMFQVPKVGAVVEEYNPTLHGPLVDLAMRPSPGIEEIELYPVNEPYAYVRVTYDSTTHEYTYHVIEPMLTPGERELFLEIKERLFETLCITSRDLTHDEARKALRDAANVIIADYGIRLDPLGREKILYHVEKEFLGDGLIDPVMHDKYIEDISCDGVGSAIFVYHTTYESMKTTLVYQDHVALDSFVTKLAQRAGKYISIAEPMLDATMSDGSRIQMTLGAEVTAHGSTFTIRKFREEPITPTDLIEWHTFSPLGIAFIWLAVENAKSCIFAGGTASGKTTTLNAISLFIPPLAKIVTLEDTRELKLPHPNWIPSITRDSFSQDGRGEIDMYELLRAALRQRPEYILVGEVRGKEALTLFQAMSTGHVTYATMHADSVASAVHRLENPPIDVPRNMLSALNLMSIQVQARIGGQRIRRNKQLIEILDIDPRTNELITNEVFRWHPATDEIRYSGKSYILEQIMEDRGWSEERMREELKRRQEVLEWMRIKKIRYFKDVSKILVSYFRDPETVVQRVRADLYGEGGSA
ncbi:secretion system protein E [Methanoculleus sp. FWC-SCC3]|uniref:Secretion system protein E n=1 Tax=Methanoculleus methanifontis TaxID=2584086 RepID=A0ABT8LXN5_9EURY|nr:ATPase, T2SS/T4P/T4SS family [Methanoculleus sp. FWC-SCC3]MDN7011544.1 secretion system protein E [Methanoculleus sp. FWC-SCC3]